MTAGCGSAVAAPQHPCGREENQGGYEHCWAGFEKEQQDSQDGLSEALESGDPCVVNACRDGGGRGEKWTVIVLGNVLSPVAGSNDSRFYRDILEEDEPLRRFNIITGSSERMVDCHAQLEGGVQRCGFEAVMPDGSVVCG